MDEDSCQIQLIWRTGAVASTSCRRQLDDQHLKAAGGHFHPLAVRGAAASLVWMTSSVSRPFSRVSTWVTAVSKAPTRSGRRLFLSGTTVFLSVTTSAPFCSSIL